MPLPAKHESGSPEERLKALNITLPPFPKSAGAYAPFAAVGDLLFVSGQLPLKADGSMYLGKVSPKPSQDGEIDVQTAKAAGRACALTTLKLLKDTLGSLDRVVRIVKLLAMVNCTPDLKEPQTVANGYSETMIEIFGEAGRSARSAVGHATLPFGVPIEVEAIVQIDLGTPKI